MASLKVVSIDPVGFPIKPRTYGGGLDIPPCPPDKPYVIKEIHDAQDEKVILQDYFIEHAVHVPVTITASEIVNDILKNENLENMGCFVTKGDKPTEKELNDAHARRIVYMERCVQAGDIIYARGQNPAEIPDFFKQFCKELGVEREWAYYAKGRLVDCPACGTQIKFGVAVCPHCKAILDAEKAKQFGLIQFPHPVQQESKPAKVI